MSEYMDSIGRLAYSITKWGKDVDGSRLKECNRTAAGGTASHSAQPSDIPTVKSQTFPSSKQQATNEAE
jgi:hypothetical protein